MIISFPEFYEDEILYSTLARHHVRSGNLSSKLTLQELFGSTTVTASMELPANINSLIANIPKYFSISAEELIHKHTLYPFYTAFLQENRANYIYNLMLGNQGSKIFTAIGATNKPIKSNNYLRFCPDCIKDDLVKYGETYWHRMHQVPGLLVCHKHRTILYDSSVDIHLRNRQTYISASMELGNKFYYNEETLTFNSCIDNNIISVEKKQIINKSLALAQNINYILNHEISHKEDNYFRNLYVSKLIEKGLAERINLIYQQDMLQAFKDYFGEDFLNLTQCNFYTDCSNWVTTISRKHRKGFHPLQHLLFMQFLDVSAKDVFEDRIEVKLKKKKNSIIINDDRNIAYRNQWLEAIKNNPEKSKTYIRDNYRSIYDWLYRHDKAWLNENSPKRKIAIHQKGRIDWGTRDKEYLQLVQEHTRLIKESDEKPERITIHLIGTKIKNSTILQKYLDKMPETKEYLMQKIESVEEFQVRRIKWAFENLAKDGLVRRWELIEFAGLSKNSSIYHHELINTLIDNQIV